MTELNAGPTPTPAPSPIAAGSLPEWVQTLPDGVRTEITSLKAEKVLEPIKGATWEEAGPEILRGFIHAQRKIGEKTEGMVRVPGKDAKPEEVAAFHKALGVPETPEGYAETVQLPEIAGVSWAPDALARFGQVFHKAGLPPSTAQYLIGAMGEYHAEQMRAFSEANVKGLETLRTEWGEPTFARRAALVQRLIGQSPKADDLKTFLNATGLGDHPLLFELLAPIAEQFAEDGLIDGRVTTAPDPAELDAKLAETRAKLLTLDRGSPEYRTLLDQYEGLLKAQVAAAKVA